MMSPRGRLLFAFLTLYLVWGSSYLVIRYAVESMPPLSMAGARFLVAGVVLYAVARASGAAFPTLPQWKAGALVGVALMGANAAVAWSERRIASGVASLIVAVTPCWMVSADAALRRERPRPAVLAGLALGMAGVVILVGPSDLVGGEHVDTAGALVVLAGTLAWTAGSLYARGAARPASPFMLSAIQMILGGFVLTVLGAAAGEWRGFSLDQVTTRSWVALAYLIALPSIAGYTSYLYVLTNASPARASTYAYVNPVIAVALGALVGGEALTSRVALTATIIVAGVVLIVTAPSSARATVAAPTTAPAVPPEPRGT